MQKVLFMPVEGTDPYAFGEYDDKNTQWMGQEAGKGNMWAQVYYDGKKHSVLENLLAGQVYIRGHGNPGDPEIQIGRGGQRVHAKEVGLRLIKSGLSRKFSGEIKCYNCHSAEADPAAGKVAFAQLLADFMSSKGYKLCTYQGYAGQLDSFHKAGSTGTHKYSREWQVTGGVGTQVEKGRASANRYQITPRG
jgi:hypothetical protein